jgi:hypothetical protein
MCRVPTSSASASPFACKRNGTEGEGGAILSVKGRDISGANANVTTIMAVAKNLRIGFLTLTLRIKNLDIYNSSI